VAESERLLIYRRSISTGTHQNRQQPDPHLKESTFGLALLYTQRVLLRLECADPIEEVAPDPLLAALGPAL